ncbi:MAG: hypothetical protein K8T89_06305 [Planctomycetes bacterium]|nr:hypothetical protein [Planctomycetota bacterium]
MLIWELGEGNLAAIEQIANAMGGIDPNDATGSNSLLNFLKTYSLPEFSFNDIESAISTGAKNLVNDALTKIGTEKGTGTFYIDIQTPLA